MTTSIISGRPPKKGIEINDGSIAHYGIMDTDSDSAPKYYGYEAKNGAWYIMKEATSGGDTNYRYVKGDLDYSTNWTNRASLSYGTFANTF